MPRRVALLAVAATALIVAAAQAEPRELDRGFGTKGVTLTPVAPGDAQANAIARRPDGSFVVVGASIQGATDHGIAILRYLPNGKPDPAFGGGDGKVGAQPGSGASNAGAVVRQPDGKIVVAGQTNYPFDPEIYVARYLANGAPDTSFGNGGVRIVPVAGDVVADASGLARQDDGKLVVAGYSIPSEHESNVVVARLTADGDLDPDYGDQGVSVLDLSDAPSHSSAAADVVIQGGKAVIAGSANRAPSGYADIMLARLDDAGALDPSFGNGGVRLDGPGGGPFSFRANALALDGTDLVVAGVRARADAPGLQYMLARYTTDGDIDTTFNPDQPEPGHVVTNTGSGDDSSAQGVVVDPDTGTATVTGYADHADARVLFVDRYTSGGVRDPNFVGANGNGGPVLLDASTGTLHDNGGTDLLLDDRGGTIVAGWAHRDRRREFLLARFGDTTLTPNVAPVAIIRGHHTVPRKTTITFRGGRSFDTDGKIVDYAWRVGHGRFHHPGPILRHRFGRTGTRTVILRVTDDDGAIDVALFRVKIVSRRG